MRSIVLAATVGLVVPAALASSGTRAVAAPRPAPRTPAARPPAPTPSAQIQREADRHFQSGVALYLAAKYDEALAEFTRAYDIAPHPLVLYNIAECQRELLHYVEAVRAYQQFLIDGKDQVPAARLAMAQSALTALLTLIARVTVTVAPPSDDMVLLVDGAPVEPEMPLLLPPGDHRFAAHAAGTRDAVRTIKLQAGDALAIDLVLAPLAVTPPATVTVPRAAPSRAPVTDRRLAVDAGLGMNLRRLGNTGAPSIGVEAAIGSRIAVGVDLVLVAYAVVPAVRVRVAGDALSLHLVGAVPIAFPDDPMSGRVISIAGGLALRYQPTPRLAFRIESYVSSAGARQDIAIPTFLGGQLWF
jgi:hypothetical protein